MLNVDNRRIERNIKKACKIAVVALLLIPRIKIEKINTNNCKTVFAGYGEAIETITNSDMFSNQKREAISVVKVNGTADYYKAIISIANNSNMFSSDKLNTIKNLSK